MLLKEKLASFLLIGLLSVLTIVCIVSIFQHFTKKDVPKPSAETEANVIVLGDKHSVYIEEEKTPLYASETNFNLLDDDWWLTNTGCDLEKTTFRSMRNVDVYDKDIYIGTNNYLLENAITVRSPEASPDNYIIFNNLRAYVRNCRLESACRIYTGGKDTGVAVVENCTFVGDKIETACIVGMATIARYNIISSQNDGISIDGGLTESSLIEYNWFLGPGKQIKDNHMDGIQIHREGNAVIRYNRFNGYTNSCILLHSAVKPRFGDQPISNVLIDHNLFEVNGLAWYYLYVCEYERDAQEESLKRPRMITITNNIFEEDKNNRVMPIYTGLTKADTAMFVKTEEERQEGMLNQEEHPEVLEFRKGLGYADSAVDARSWIVWSGNRWQNSGEEVEPGDGKGGPGGWYQLKDERTFLKEKAKELNQEELTVSFTASSINDGYLQWPIVNHTDKKILYTAVFPGEDKERLLWAQPGENVLKTLRMPGNNTLTVKWPKTDGTTGQEVIYGGDHSVKDLETSYSSSSTPGYVWWDIRNPNGFTVKYNWEIEGSSLSGVGWAASGNSVLKTLRQPGENRITLTWSDEFGNDRTCDGSTDTP